MVFTIRGDTVTLVVIPYLWRVACHTLDPGCLEERPSARLYTRTYSLSVFNWWLYMIEPISSKIEEPSGPGRLACLWCSQRPH